MNGHPVNGATLRRARRDAGVPLVVVARRLYMTAGHLRSIENGRRTAREEIVTAYARVLAERGATLSVEPETPPRGGAPPRRPIRVAHRPHQPR